MGGSYAIVWEEPDGSTWSGSVEATADGLSFHGAAAGLPVERDLPFADLVLARTLRTGGELIGGRTTLLLETVAGERFHVAAVAGVGALAELAALLAQRVGARPAL